MHEINPIRDHRWREFVQGHPHSSVFHTPEWFEALRQTYGYEPVAFVDVPPEGTITSGLAFCFVDSWLTGKRLISIPFSDHAALLDSDDENISILDQVKQTLGDSKRYRYVEFRPREQEDLSRWGFSKSKSYYLHTMDLGVGLEKLFHSFHKDCVRRKIMRADREHLEYEEGRSKKLLAQFYRLLLLTQARHHSPPQPISWFRNLAIYLKDSMKVRIASKDGRPIAGMITLTHNKTMTYKYGCSDKRYNNLGGVALLFWRSIQEAVASGMTEFDMGRSDLEHTGLITFKEHWGAHRKLINYWRYQDKKEMVPRDWEVRLATSFAKVAPPVLLRAAGSLFYKHMA